MITSILEFDTLADAQQANDIITPIIQASGLMTMVTWAVPRQPTKIEYDFWLLADPIDKLPSLSVQVYNALTDEGVVYRVKPSPYEHDYTFEELNDYLYGETEQP